ncbi:large conductance mechanosensitive channel protein MscL [Gordonia sp. HY002]|uniref:large conductance mechanosensitive channel protein MscL n=1 Tax=Gordonia zhenghanii TaxID=2911516 RepID=UPI001EF07F45|nr:large conductance mechanosensitive channel protein MscL [Gordonia zhenghanii]MCF8570280.1 large conductance mechanosensitive channel protein MscL [Gordonia zhenghanii]MCF8605539.1 large conductance mechanosensitive channel protein MscL [Gordonia zhenghanii]
MLKGFKDFLMRGNVVELATAVIIGAAFTAVVTAFTDKIVAPLIAAIPVNTDFAGFGFSITKTDSGQADPATFLDFGAVITALINFVIVAAVVYFLIIVPYNKLTELRTLEEEAEDDSEISLLVEIRDLLDPGAKERKAADAEKKALADAEAVRSAESRFDPPHTGPQAPAENYPSGGATQQMGVPPQAQQQAPAQGQQYPAGPPSGGFPTPNPAPGEYPPPGNLPPGQYAPGQYPPPAPGQYPPAGGQYPQDPGFGAEGPRHSR